MLVLVPRYALVFPTAVFYVPPHQQRKTRSACISKQKTCARTNILNAREVFGPKITPKLKQM